MTNLLTRDMRLDHWIILSKAFASDAGRTHPISISSDT
jgi:hypothetical protein